MFTFLETWNSLSSSLCDWLIARRIVRQASDADDVMQEGFVRAAKAWVEGVVRDPFRWLKEILRHASVDFYRASRDFVDEALVHDQLDARADDHADPSLLAERRERDVLVERECARLPRDQREALVLHVLDDHPYEEIAASLRRYPGATRMLACRATATLRERLA